MNKLTWKNFFDFSLISYFDVYKGNETLEDLILSILLDKQLIEQYGDDVLFQMNLESLRQINPQTYRDVYIEEVWDDNCRSGLYVYRFSFQGYEILSIRGSEELDAHNHRTGWQDWKDNFQMYLPGPTFQQLYMMEYINGLHHTKKRYLCGHSKGGHLAIFVAMAGSQQIFNTIKHVYAFNAPGIPDSLWNDYRGRIDTNSFQEKITLIENEHDCISSFFHHVKTPCIVKSIVSGNTMKQLYEAHQLHTMKIVDNAYVEVNKKGIVPRLTHYFINDFFTKQSQEKLQGIVARMDEYFDSGLSKNELYRVLIYQISKYTNLFDELCYDEVANITFQDLMDRRKTRILYDRMKEAAPKGYVIAVFKQLKIESPLAKLSDFDIRLLADTFLTNYETIRYSTSESLKTIMIANKRRMVPTFQNIQNRFSDVKSLRKSNHDEEKLIRM